MRVLFCDNSFPEAREILKRHLPHDELASCNSSDIIDAVRDADVIIPLMTRVDERVMNAGRFRLIQQWGAGLEGVDLEAARARRVWVANVPSLESGNAESVAEHAVLLTLALLRQLPVALDNIRAGLLGVPMGHTLQGRTVCVFGLGAIGQAIVGRLLPFGSRLIAVTRRPHPDVAAALQLSAIFPFERRNEALSQSDMVVLCLPLNSSTRSVIDAAALAAVPAGAYIVNVARGALIDYAALVGALVNGHLAGAALDVFWDEPINANDPLLTLPNVIATPHIAGVTDRSYAGIANVVAANIGRLRSGETPLHVH